MEKLSSRSLALALASAYLVVSTLTGIALMTERKPEPRVLDATTYDYTATTTRATTTTTRPARRTTTTTADTSYDLVNGAYELVTAVPEGWAVRQGDVSTVSVARSDTMPGYEVRFGGAPPEDPAKTLFERISSAHEAKLGKNSYSMETLRDTRFHGYPAVEWSYTTTSNGVPQFCTGAWWEAGGIEYVLFVVSPPSGRATAEKLLNLMTTHAKP